ncbi:hypothetical protein ACFQ38_16270 [Sporosarcina contaminans]|uniref:Uncharacterized protein n=1 Tax=Sporosarcina contaminans TaxID=633403 RepID=A0ABW3U1I3_9BACL
MAYQQKDYYITAKDNEYYKVMGVVKHALEQSRENDGSPMWNETLEKLFAEMKENQGDHITPWQLNMVIMLLLDYVPEEIKNSY